MEKILNFVPQKLIEHTKEENQGSIGEVHLRNVSSSWIDLKAAKLFTEPSEHYKIESKLALRAVSL